MDANALTIVLAIRFLAQNKFGLKQTAKTDGSAVCAHRRYLKSTHSGLELVKLISKICRKVNTLEQLLIY